MSPPIRAVLFDFGGVILSSPIDELLAYEVEVGLPAGFLQNLNKQRADDNAWARMERGELSEEAFYDSFEAEARALGGTVDARALFRRLTGHIREEMVDAVRALRSRYITMCVTNNMRLGFGSAMASTEEKAAEIARAMMHFQHVVESYKIGARKPERRFFEHACAIAGLQPAECVFLDDLGTNLKTARTMGMRTIKVGDPGTALEELEAILGHTVRAR